MAKQSWATITVPRYFEDKVLQMVFASALLPSTLKIGKCNRYPSGAVTLLLKTKRIDGVDPILSKKIESLEGDKDFAGWVTRAWEARIENSLASKNNDSKKAKKWKDEESRLARLIAEELKLPYEK